MTTKKEYLPTMSTPVGVLGFAHLAKPDTKFKAEGEYSAKLVLDEETDGAFLAKLRDLYEAEFAKAVAENPKKKLKRCDLIKDVVDRDTDDVVPGKAELRFGKPGKTKQKDGTMKPVPPRPIYDAAGKPTKVVPYSGSRVKIIFSPSAWVNAKGEFGIKLYLDAVKIIGLSNGGGRDLSQFLEPEDGYVANDSEPDDVPEDDGDAPSTDF